MAVGQLDADWLTVASLSDGMTSPARPPPTSRYNYVLLYAVNVCYNIIGMGHNPEPYRAYMPNTWSMPVSAQLYDALITLLCIPTSFANSFFNLPNCSGAARYAHSVLSLSSLTPFLLYPVVIRCGWVYGDRWCKFSS